MQLCMPPIRKFEAFFCVLTVLIIFLPLNCGVFAASPIGKVASSGHVLIAGSVAPTGTVILSGERVAAENAPVLVTFQKGGSVLLNEGAAATFSQNGNLLLIQPDKGTLNYNFPAKEEVRIQAGTNLIASLPGNVGAFMVNSAGRLSNPEASEAPVPLPQGVKGNLTKGGNRFTDSSAKWDKDKLKGQSLVIIGQKYKIESNTDKTITIVGTFALDTGSYGYDVKKAGMSAGAKAGIGIAVAGGAGGGIMAMGGKSK
jgi:hypothetical protein